jgi:hypothetical protein
MQIEAPLILLDVTPINRVRQRRRTYFTARLRRLTMLSASRALDAELKIGYFGLFGPRECDLSADV